MSSSSAFTLNPSAMPRVTQGLGQCLDKALDVGVAATRKATPVFTGALQASVAKSGVSMSDRENIKGSYGAGVDGGETGTYALIIEVRGSPLSRGQFFLTGTQAEVGTALETEITKALT